MSLIVKTEDEYEDLLGLWSDLESGLAVVLTHPDSVQEFAQRIHQYDRWLQDLLKQDTDVSLYLLFQLATKSPVGYSASHALVCGVLCDLIASDFSLPRTQRDSLVRAALTMNVAMTVLQDEMATQRGRPTREQQIAIKEHPEKAVQILESKGITDALWLDVVRNHHAEDVSHEALIMLPEPRRLAHILLVVDRYAAMISPRESREGQSAADSASKLIQGQTGHGGVVGQALVRIVGFCPPGTFVQLEDSRVAIVTRRTKLPNQPAVVVVIDEQGKLARPPVPHSTSGTGAGIASALLASAVRERINHHLILQLDAATADA
ncbi:phosphodiesterase [Rhodoferax sp.]|uniref:HD-GYP domain-containing protein n=1 Tax=Rhodoferax sp. TaxID=50421 RepID=UPI00284FA888|nr:phosphodiesterase [Rhodoferax sp.]MDR3368673.1 phosphodiesterase [Rhodoferax sp.]